MHILNLKQLENAAKKLGIHDKECRKNSIFLEIHRGVSGKRLAKPQEVLVPIPELLEMDEQTLATQFDIDFRGINSVRDRCARITALHEQYTRLCNVV